MNKKILLTILVVVVTILIVGCVRGNEETLPTCIIKEVCPDGTEVTSRACTESDIADFNAGKVSTTPPSTRGGTSAGPSGVPGPLPPPSGTPPPPPAKPGVGGSNTGGVST